MDTEKSAKGLEMKYFVLKPKGDSPYATASRKAMAAYADAIDRENPQLATDLMVWITEEVEQILKDEKNKGGCGCGYCDT